MVVNLILLQSEKLPKSASQGFGLGKPTNKDIYLYKTSILEEHKIFVLSNHWKIRNLRTNQISAVQICLTTTPPPSECNIKQGIDDRRRTTTDANPLQ